LTSPNATHKDRFSQYAEIASEWYWEMDSDLHYSFISEAYEKRRDEAVSNLLGRTHREVLSTITQHESQGAFIALLERHQPVDKMHLCREYADGRTTWAEVSCRPVFDDAGNFEGYYGTSRDIASLKLSEQLIKDLSDSEARYRLMADNLPVMIVFADLERRYRFVNKFYLDWHGVDEGQVLGRTVSEIMGPQAYGAVREFIDLAYAGQSQHYDVKVNFKTVGLKWVRIDYLPLVADDGSVSGIYGLVTDISEHKLLEEDLRNSQELLEDTVRARTAELSQSKDHVEAIVRNTAEGIVTISNRAIIETFNLAAENIFGVTAKEIIGKNISTLMEKSSRSDHDKYVSNSELHVPRIIHQSRDLMGMKKDGSIFPLELNVSPMKIKGETKYIGILRDISERKISEKQLRESEEKFHKFYDLLPDMFTILDLETGAFVEVNDGFCDLTGHSREDAIGKTSLELGIWQDTELRDDLISKLRRGAEVRNFSANHRSKDGSIWPAMVSISLLELDGRELALASTRNVSEIKQSQEAAESASQAKSKFLSSMSHELRTPLNSIVGFSQLLESDPEQPLTEDQQDNISHISKSSLHLLSLINDILDLSKIEAGEMKFDIADVSVDEAIAHCFSQLGLMAEERGITLSNSNNQTKKLMVRADQIRLVQVLLNMLSNAIKYNRENGTVFVEVEATTRGMLRVAVRDTGEGILRNKQEKLFEPFNRLGAESRKIEGTGIGLVISKELIGRMNGVMGMESEVGVGSTFWFELPISDNDGVDKTGVDKVPGELGNALHSEIVATLLYVEDNPGNLALMEKIVSRVDGLSMISAHTGELGIELAKANRPDIIILDINLPNMNGIEALAQLRQIDDMKDTPVIALSADANSTAIETALAAGFWRYYTKPFKIPEFLGAIKTALADHRR